MDKFGIGQPVRRKEDVRLLTGRGTYTDDVNRPGQAQAYVLRSPHAHARILSIHVTAAKSAPGVVAVLTGHDAAADGIGQFPVMVDVPGKGGTKLFPTPREILQTEKVRFVGDPVALVIAETPRRGAGRRRTDRGRLRDPARASPTPAGRSPRMRR